MWDLKLAKVYKNLKTKDAKAWKNIDQSFKYHNSLRNESHNDME